MRLQSRLALLASVAAFTGPTAGFAQDRAPSSAPPSSAPAGEAAPDIIVTGSRIARPDFAEPNPIVSFNADAVQKSGDTNVTNFLERVPALTGSLDSTQTSGGNALYRSPNTGDVGLNELNLRNLGTSRTLVLVDGRRHVAGEVGSAAVDVNSIPTDLISRVDVLTGGASAVYGADGVSGVVNFILKRDFEGLAGRAQAGLSQYSDGGNQFLSLTAGHNFADGRANLTLAFEHSADSEVENDARPFLRQANRQYLVPNTANPDGAPNLPINVLVGDLRYPNESFNSAVFIGSAATPTFDGYGRPYAAGSPVSYYSTGGEDSPVAGFYSGDLFPKVVRNDVNLLGHFDVSDALKISVEGTYARTSTLSYDFIDGTYYYPIPVANPYVPLAIRDAATAADADTVYINRDNPDYGRHGEADLRQTYRGVLSLAGRFNDHARYDAYVEYGQTDTDITKLNDRLADRFNAAADAVVDPRSGQIVCRSGIDPTASTALAAVTFTPGGSSGCVPINLFGAGPTSDAALGFFRTDDHSFARLTQLVGNASVSGDFGQLFALPGGPVQYSFGGEYRRETSRFSPSANLVANRYFTYDEPSLVTPAAGHFDVKEAFGELNAPLLQDRPFAATLSLGAAGRYSHYSTIGDTSTWQFTGVYSPVRDISFRGTYGKAVRAPNIGELFQPETGTANFFTDPCQPSQIGNGSSYRAANCQALLSAVGATINPGLQTASNIFGTASGNANLTAEVARTWTGGVVFRPRMIRGLVVAVDWYDITLKNAINTPSPQQLAELCVDQPSIANQFCAAITRAQGTGIISGYVVSPQNVSQFRTAGLDLNITYTRRTRSVGDFDLRFVGGYLHRLDFIGTPGAAPIDSVDQPGAPRWNFAFTPNWSLGALSLSYVLRYQDGTRTQPKATTDAQPNYAPPDQLRYSALWQHDVQLGYRVTAAYSLYAGVNNLTGQKPDQGNATNLPISPLGTFFYVGVKVGRR